MLIVGSMNLIIFDCDGTIVDSQHLIVAAMDRAFALHGIAILPRAKTLSIVGLSLNEAVTRLIPGADASAVAAIAQSYKDAFGELRRDPANHEPMYPGALEAIRALSQRSDTVLGVATGKSRRGVAALFDRMDLHPYFVTIQTADTHPSKPHPSMIRTAIEEAGASAATTVMIGDTHFDMEMACRAEVAALGVAWGYHPVAELKAKGAHAIATHYDEIPGLVERLLSPEAQP